MKYFVRTTGERTLHESFSQIKYELLVDKEHNARKSFLEYLATLNCDCVIFEDDIILCKDFKNRFKTIVKEHSKDVINFFFSPNRYFPSRYTVFFNWNQGVYYPKSVLKKLSVKMRELYTQYPDVPHDELEGQALLSLGIKTYLPRPCLIQHIDLGSLIQPRILTPRRTPFFIDYLDELGIPYEDAYKYKQELLNLMKEKFKDMK